MAGRKVEGNHKIVESQEERTPAEELIAQQNNTSEEYEFGEDEESPEEAIPKGDEESVKEETLPDSKENTMKAAADVKRVILTGAASYYGCGKRFFKNVAETVDEEAYGKLLSTGFFIGE